MIKEDCPVTVYTLFSSSTGNSTYATDGETHFLIDAGYNMKHITEALRSLGASPSDIAGIFITHEHSDHTAALRCLCKKYALNVRAVRPAAEKLGLDPDCCFPFGETVRLGAFSLSAFRLSHDTEYCAGYTVRHDSGVSFATLTDTGYVTEEAKNALAGIDAVILESNYDENMLTNGPYAPELKRRIRSERGHLSNAQAAEFLPYLYKYGTRRVLLSHISPENNTKETAYENACKTAEKYGMKDLIIGCADRFLPTRLL